MKLLLVVMLTSVVGVSPMPTAVLKAQKLVYSLLARALSIEQRSPCEGEKCGGTIPKKAEELGLTEFMKYIEATKLTETLTKKGPFTVFAPTNEVFEALPEYLSDLLKNATAVERIMKYSVIEKEMMPTTMENDMLVPTLLGGEDKIRFNIYHGDDDDDKVITASGRPIKLPENKATNGLLYEVEGLIQPPTPPMATSFKECPTYKMLAKALEKAGMEEMLDGKGPFTMFAPTDKAFAKIPKETLDSLMKDTTALKKLLMYHVVSGTYYTAGWKEEDTLTTESGKTITVKKDDDTFTVNTIRVTLPDTTSTNGVVHVVDTVLMPPTAHLEFVFTQ